MAQALWLCGRAVFDEPSRRDDFDGFGQYAFGIVGGGSGRFGLGSHALAKEGKVLILRPNHLLNSFESDVRKLEMAYWHGYRMTKEKMKKNQEVY